jgi:hypothetical protein
MLHALPFTTFGEAAALGLEFQGHVVAAHNAWSLVALGHVGNLSNPAPYAHQGRAPAALLRRSARQNGKCRNCRRSGEAGPSRSVSAHQSRYLDRLPIGAACWRADAASFQGLCNSCKRRDTPTAEAYHCHN